MRKDKPWGIGEVIITWLLPAVRKRVRGMLRMKFLGVDIGFYWARATGTDWGWGFALLFWGFGFDLDSRPFSFHWIHEDHWYWLPEAK